MNTTQRTLAALTLFCAPVAVADVLPNIELTPYVGYRGGGKWLDAVGDAEIQSDVSFGVIANFRASYKTQWELIYGHHGTDLEFSDGVLAELAFDFLHVGGTYVFSEERLAPFLSLALGATRISPDESAVSSETYFSGSLGVGLRYELTPSMGLRFEGRASGLFGKSNSLVFCENVDASEVCFLGGDRGIIPQFEALLGLTFKY
ncbi:MAG: hypothetical protein AB8G16_19695 [Gammaproteobacteria bacterium]